MAHWDKDNDIVWICPDDTQGEVITIEGLKIGLPAVPPKEEILFHDLPKEEQYWRAEEPPDQLMDIETDEEYQMMPKEFKRKWDRYIEKQFERRRKGVWFYNCGKPTYITGEHWYLLQWCYTGAGRLKYFETQAELEIHWEACKVDPRCHGQNFVKNRRFGWTTVATKTVIEQTTGTEKAESFIVSNEFEHAKETIFQEMVMYMFNQLPFFFRPLREGKEEPKERLVLKAPSSLITKNYKGGKKGKGITSSITVLPTKNKKGDGKDMFILIMDEAGKYSRPHNIEKSWQIKKRALEKRSLITGKCRMGSTVGPMSEGGKEYKQLFFDGLLVGDNATGRNPNGRTKAGLYSIFIPAYRCIIYDKYGRSVVEDPEEPFIDIDGKEREIGGKTFLLNQREALKTEIMLYNEEVRQMPFTIREAFMDAIESAAFNIQKIEEQRAYLDLLRNKQNPVLKGRFEWTDGFGSDVIWTPDSQSYRFKVTWLQEPELRNKKEKRGGSWFPPNGWMGVGGLDPYALDTAAYGGSKGAIYFFNKDNPRAPSNAFVLQYIHRPPAIVDFYEDALKAAIYYGYPILIENSKYEIATHFINWGYGHYLLSRPRISLNPLSKPSPAEMVKKGIPATVEIIRQLDNYTDEYINKYVGYNEDGEIGDGVYFDELLEDWKQYDPKSRTKHDATVAASHALYAAKIKIDGSYDDGEKKKTPLLRTYRV